MTSENPVLRDYPNPWLNAFIMMRFEDTPQQRLVLETLKATLRRYGINPLRADDKMYNASLWENVVAYLDACDLGIAILDQINAKDFNPNVSLELGYMLGCHKSVLILKERRLERLPADIAGHLYREFDAFEIETTVASQVRAWLGDVGIARSGNERVLLFVSRGGTCRCAMAKVVTQQALNARKLPFKLRAMSVAYEYGDTNVASSAARQAISEAFGEDHLAEHRVIRRSPGLSEDADLILVMEDALREGFPREKTFVFNEFFGLEGDVEDPWPDEGDQATHDRYSECLVHLRSVLEANSGRLVRYLAERGAA